MLPMLPNHGTLFTHHNRAHRAQTITAAHCAQAGGAALVILLAAVASLSWARRADSERRRRRAELELRVKRTLAARVSAAAGENDLVAIALSTALEIFPSATAAAAAAFVDGQPRRIAHLKAAGWDPLAAETLEHLLREWSMTVSQAGAAVTWVNGTGSGAVGFGGSLRGPSGAAGGSVSQAAAAAGEETSVEAACGVGGATDCRQVIDRRDFAALIPCSDRQQVSSMHLFHSSLNFSPPAARPSLPISAATSQAASLRSGTSQPPATEAWAPRSQSPPR